MSSTGSSPSSTRSSTSISRSASSTSRMSASSSASSTTTEATASVVPITITSTTAVAPTTTTTTTTVHTTPLPVTMPSPTPRPSPPPARTTAAPTPVTTFSSSFFITTTDHRGGMTTTAPPEITQTSTFTSDQGTYTVTQIGVNPTLSPNNNSASAPFFSKPGPVAAVFIVVGLALASIALWIYFALRRRRIRREHEFDALNASLPARGVFHRVPLNLDDDDDDITGPGAVAVRGQPETRQRAGSRAGLAAPELAWSTYRDGPHQGSPPFMDSFDPFGDDRQRHPRASDSAARADSPLSPPAGQPRPGYGHTPSNSAASTEPLLAGHRSNLPTSAAAGITAPTTIAVSGAGPPVPPPRSPLRPPPFLTQDSYQSSVSVHSVDQSNSDDRLDPQKRLGIGAGGVEGLSSEETLGPRDDRDYSRALF